MVCIFNSEEKNSRHFLKSMCWGTLSFLNVCCCVYVCTHAYIGACILVHVEHRGPHVVIFSCSPLLFCVLFICGFFVFVFLKPCLSLHLLLNIAVGSGILLSPPPALELQAHTGSRIASCFFGFSFLIWVLGIELKSSYSQSKHYPWSQLPSFDNFDHLLGIRNWKVELNVVIIRGKTVAWVRAKEKNPLESYTNYS